MHMIVHVYKYIYLHELLQANRAIYLVRSMHPFVNLFIYLFINLYIYLSIQ